MSLTDAAIRSLKPTGKPFKVLEFAGLFLFVKPTGSKLWQVKYRTCGKEKLLAIGICPEMGLAMAGPRKAEARALLAGPRKTNSVRNAFGLAVGHGQCKFWKTAKGRNLCPDEPALG